MRSDGREGAAEFLCSKPSYRWEGREGAADFLCSKQSQSNSCVVSSRTLRLSIKYVLSLGHAPPRPVYSKGNTKIPCLSHSLDLPSFRIVPPSDTAWNPCRGSARFRRTRPSSCGAPFAPPNQTASPGRSPPPGPSAGTRTLRSGGPPGPSRGARKSRSSPYPRWNVLRMTAICSASSPRVTAHTIFAPL